MRKERYSTHQYSMEAKWPKEVLEEGFTSLPNSFIKHRAALGLNPTEFYVFFCLESFRWEEGRNPYPSLYTLSELSGLSISTLTRATRKLERQGLIAKSYTFNNSVTYDLTLASQKLKLLTDASVTSSLYNNQWKSREEEMYGHV